LQLVRVAGHDIFLVVGQQRAHIELTVFKQTFLNVAGHRINALHGHEVLGSLHEPGRRACRVNGTVGAVRFRLVQDLPENREQGHQVVLVDAQHVL